MGELVTVVALLGSLVGVTVWLLNRGRSTGRNEVIVDAQAEIIKDLQERNEIERTTPVAGAADRLQNGPFSRD